MPTEVADVRTSMLLLTVLSLSLRADCASAQSSGADTPTFLTGTVFGAGQVLSGASVVVAGTPTAAATDALGDFRLAALPGRRFLHVRAVGYEPFDSLLFVAGGTTSL